MHPVHGGVGTEVPGNIPPWCWASVLVLRGAECCRGRRMPLGMRSLRLALNGDLHLHHLGVVGAGTAGRGRGGLWIASLLPQPSRVAVRASLPCCAQPLLGWWTGGEGLRGRRLWLALPLWALAAGPGGIPSGFA